MNDHEQMIISALRYALPRRSYIMSVTDEYITKMLKGAVSKNFLTVIVQDIENHYRLTENSSPDVLSYDWIPLLKLVKNRLEDNKFFIR